VIKKRLFFGYFFLVLLFYLPLVYSDAEFANNNIVVHNDTGGPYTCFKIAQNISNSGVINFTPSNNTCWVNYNITIEGRLDIFNETWFINSTTNGSIRLTFNSTSPYLNVTQSNLTNNGTVGGAGWLLNFNVAGGAGAGGASELFIKDSHISNYGNAPLSAFTIADIAFLTLINNTLDRGVSGLVFDNGGSTTNGVNFIIANNTILRCTSPVNGAGIFFSSSIHNVTVTNNTIDRCFVGIKIQNNNTVSIMITNNTIINITSPSVLIESNGDTRGVGIYVNGTRVNLTNNRFEGNNISVVVQAGGDKTLIYNNIFKTDTTGPNHYINTTTTLLANFTSYGNFYGDAFNTSLQDVNGNGVYDSLYNESVSSYIKLNGGVYNDNKPVVCERGWETNTSCVHLVIPANSASITSAGQNLTYFPGGSLNFTNCSLVISRSGTETTNYTNTTITAGIRRNFTLTGLPTGSFTWSVNCQTNRTSSAATLVRSSSNFTLTVGNTPPQFGYRNISGTTNITDVTIFAGSVTNNFGSGTALVIGLFNSGNSKTLFNFTLPTLPNASISSAILRLYNLSTFGSGNVNGGTINVSAYMVNSSWLEGTCSTGTGCANNLTWNGSTWNERYNGTNWVSTGGDYYTHINDSEINFTPNSIVGTINVTLTTLFGYWENGTYSNLGVILTDSQASDRRAIFSSTEGTSGRTPYVDLNFTMDPITTNDTQNVTINLTYYFNDDDAGHKLTYACQFLHGIGNCTDNKDGTVTIKPMAFGNETIIINGSDEFGATTMSNPIRIVVNDTIKPVASAGSPTGIVETSSVTLSLDSNENTNCRGSLDKDESYGELDFAFSGANLSHTYSLSLVGIASGKHTIYSNCQDFPGRNYLSGSFSWTFTYSPSLGGGGGAGGGTGGGSGGDAGSEEGNTSDNQEGGEDEEEDYVVESGETVDIGLLSRTQEKGVQSAKQGRIKFDLTNDPGNYYLEIVSFSDNLLTLRYGVSKTLLTIVLGGEKQIDFNGDGLVDVIISFNAIIGNKVDLSLREISQSPERLDILEKEVSYGWAYLLVILVILIAFGYLWMQRRKKKR